MYKRVLTGLTIGSFILINACDSGSGIEAVKKELEEKKSDKRELEQLIDSLQKIVDADTTFRENVIPVGVKTIKPETFSMYYESSGTVKAVNDAVISPEIPGQIRKIYVDEGQRVKKGQLLAVLNTDVTQKQIEELKTGLELAKTMYEKQKDLWDQKIGSEVQFLQAKNNMQSLEKKLESVQTQMAKAYIRAPFSGIVDDISNKEGELANPGFPLMHVVNLQKMKIIADVSETYLPAVNVGDTIIVRFPAFSEHVIHAPVYRTGSVINPENRTFELEVRFTNIDEKIKPNLLSRLKMMVYEHDSTFVVPSIIIKNDLNDKQYLYTVGKGVDGKLIAKKTFVQTGKSYNDRTEVSGGLKAGQQVIVSGYNLVTENGKVEITG